MSKLLEIDNCIDCEYCAKYSISCFHPEAYGRSFNNTRVMYTEIPEWCPLFDMAGKNKRPIICLCGSVRFKTEYEYLNAFYTCRGYIVLSVGCFGKDYDGAPLNRELKEKLDKLHKDKIKIADIIFIINKDGYIGKSTRSELEYAEKLGKKILFYSESARKTGYIEGE